LLLYVRLQFCSALNHLSPHFPRSSAMKRLTAMARNFMNQEDGAALVEYGMLVLLIALLCILAVKAIGSKISNGFNTVNSNLP
jgi:pilus assembly protein Flp/PilA